MLLRKKPSRKSGREVIWLSEAKMLFHLTRRIPERLLKNSGGTKDMLKYRSKSIIHGVLPYQKIKEDFQKAARELNLNVEIHEGLMEKGLELAKLDNIQVIIARGGTAEAIRSFAPHVSVVDIPVTGFDIIKAIIKAQGYGEKICIVGYKSMLNQLNQVIQIRNIFTSNINTFACDSVEDLENRIKLIVKEGVDCIIGGKRSYDIAMKLGINAVVIDSSQESILEALKQAKNIIDIKNTERKRTLLFEALMDYTFEGIIAVDENGFIRFCNSVAIQLMHLNNDNNVIDRHYTKVFPIELIHFLTNPEKQLNELIKVKTNSIVVNKVPIIHKGNDFGFVLTFKDFTKIQDLEQKLRRQIKKRGLDAKIYFENIIYSSVEMKKILNKARKISELDSFILIEAETGTGKEMIAQSIHNNSKRQNGPFVAINCGAVSESLLESQLFGYSGGSFTGASKEGKAGVFELAHGGTIFLDEISSISTKVQQSLLRVIEEKEVMRIGDEKIVPIDIRVIAATNVPLIELVREGQFREDLYYRLNVFKLKIPPLRERKEDIIPLITYFLKVYARKYSLKEPQLNKKAINLLNDYSWPGNVRELRNFAENFVVLQKDIITEEDIYELIPMYLNNTKENKNQSEINNIKNIRNITTVIEKEVINGLIKEGYNKKQIAQMFGINRTTLWRKLK